MVVVLDFVVLAPPGVVVVVEVDPLGGLTTVVLDELGVGTGTVVVVFVDVLVAGPGVLS